MTVQGDTSGCSQGSVDIKTEVPFKYKESILKRNFNFDVNNLTCHPVGHIDFVDI